jgi:hypothetical protein
MIGELRGEGILGFCPMLSMMYLCYVHSIRDLRKWIRIRRAVVAHEKYSEMRDWRRRRREGEKEVMRT